MPSSLVGVVAQGDVAALQVASEDLEAHVPNLDHRTDAPYRGGTQDDAVAVAAHVHGVALREIVLGEELHRRFVCCLVVGHAGGHVSLQRPLCCFAGLLYASGFHPLPGTLCEILDGPQALFLGLLGLSAASTFKTYFAVPYAPLCGLKVLLGGLSGGDLLHDRLQARSGVLEVGGGLFRADSVLCFGHGAPFVSRLSASRTSRNPTRGQSSPRRD